MSATSNAYWDISVDKSDMILVFTELAFWWERQILK